MKLRNLSKNPTYGRIGESKLYSRIKILMAGMFAGLSGLYLSSSKELGLIFAAFAASIFIWDIVKQTQSAISVEKRISDLEKTVKEQSEKIQRLEDTNNSKSNNQ